MADDEFTPRTATETPAAESGEPPAKKAPAKKSAAKKSAAKKSAAKKTAAKKAPAKKAPAKKAAGKLTAAVESAAPAAGTDGEPTAEQPAEKAGAKKAGAKKAAAKKSGAKKTSAAKTSAAKAVDAAQDDSADAADGEATAGAQASGTMLLFKAPEPGAAGKPARAKPAKRTERAEPELAADPEPTAEPSSTDDEADDAGDSGDSGDSADGGEGGARRRRRRGGRRRRKPGDGEAADQDAESGSGSDSDKRGPADSSDDDDDDDGTSRRRRKRRREGDNGGGSGDDPEKTVTRVRRTRSAEDEITAVAGSTRLEAKKQRRREGREAGRRRAPIVSEAEFLARRESVERVMVVRQRGELTQIGVIEDKVLVEHYVARESQTSLIGNVYLGRVQNVLPSMEAAFIDIGKGRNAVLYAGEVNWSALGHKDGTTRKIESVLTSGQPVLVQVTKDPVGHKGARLSSQISLAGRFLVYVPDGTTSGISRKLPDTERNRLKTLLKEIVPDTAGVIVRTAAEGASEDELTRDVERLRARWEDIDSKSKGKAPQLLYGEPDLTLKVVRDLFTEDFSKLVIQGSDAWDTVQSYVAHVAPDLEERLERYESGTGTDIFAAYRVDEQIAKALDRKVWLPSGGSLIIDRTEAMTVVDVNTGKFTGSGGNLEETVTKNNLEAAEEVVRQLRLRDIGGIIVVDFIDMVLESNRDLVLRRLVECLGRDRTRHQVAEVTSLGLVQMTRKRIGTGLVESFSENCQHCQGRGVVIHDAPAEASPADDEQRRGGGGRRRGGRGGRGDDNAPAAKPVAPSPKDIAAMAKPPAEPAADETEVEPAAVASVVEPAEIPSEPRTPTVVTRTRRRSASRPAGSPEPTLSDGSEEPAAATEAVESVEIIETALAPEPTVSDVEPAAVVAGPPKVVTRTRGRRASRPAGTPNPTEVEPIVMASEPVTMAVETAASPVSTPEPPKVVTRTRGGSASRQAGPPSSAAAAANGDEAGSVSARVIEHVPVKKKGARKR